MFKSHLLIMSLLCVTFTWNAHAAYSWAWDRVNQRYQPLDQYTAATYDGTGVHIYVIGTGIDAAAASIELPGRAICSSPFDGGACEDPNGLGTYLASVAAGENYGIANKSYVHSVKALNAVGSSSTFQLVQAVQWVQENHYQPAVALIAATSGPSMALDYAVANLIASGVTVVVSGPNLQDACTGSPTRVDGVITVAPSKSNDSAAPYTPHGTCVDLYAPGDSVTGKWLGWTQTSTLSGSASAAAVVAGAAALVLDFWPGATPKNVKDVLLCTATDHVLWNVPDYTPNRLLYIEGFHTYSGGSCDYPWCPQEREVTDIYTCWDRGGELSASEIAGPGKLCCDTGPLPCPAATTCVSDAGTCGGALLDEEIYGCDSGDGTGACCEPACAPGHCGSDPWVCNARGGAVVEFGFCENDGVCCDTPKLQCDQSDPVNQCVANAGACNGEVLDGDVFECSSGVCCAQEEGANTCPYSCELALACEFFPGGGTIRDTYTCSDVDHVCCER